MRHYKVKMLVITLRATAKKTAKTYMKNEKIMKPVY